MPLNVEILEQSFEKVKPRANEFAASFYENLFKAHPEIKPLFANTDMVNQQKKLLNSLVLVVENLRNPDVLEPVLNALGARHVGYGAIPKYYGPVREALLETFEQYLLEDWTPEVKKAWLDAYRAITTLMLKGAGVEAENPPLPPLQTGEFNVPTKVKVEVAENAEEQAVTKPIEQKIKEIEQVETAEGILAEVKLLESSFEKIKPRADEFAASFYENLFIANPEVKPLFANTDMGNQGKKLLNSLVLVVENLRNPEALEPVLNALGARHVGYGAIPKYYGPVGEALLKTFEQYLLEDWTPEVKKAWVNAYRAITALMLKGAGKKSSSQVVQTEKPSNVQKTFQPEKNPGTLAQPSRFKPEIQEETQEFQTIAKKKKKKKDKLGGQGYQKNIKNWTGNYLKKNTIFFQKIFKKVFIQLPGKVINAFWIAPTWLVALATAVFLIGLVVVVDQESALGKIVAATESISILLALVLYVKETPDRRKEVHYQAWSTIDAAHNIKVSYARILAMQDLNEDGVSLRGLDAPGAELLDINLSHANLSKSNLMESDLTNANLSYANLDNANLSKVKLSGANLSHAKLGFALLIQANLSSANLRNANLICADLSNANLSGADLKNASLSGANLKGAYLTGADITNAKVSDYELSSAFLEGAIMPDGRPYKSSA